MLQGESAQARASGAVSRAGHSEALAAAIIDSLELPTFISTSDCDYVSILSFDIFNVL